MSSQPAKTQLFLPPTLVNVGWRYLLRHGWQTLLMILGITLGVAVVVSVDMANASASRAFDLSTETVAGRTTHQIVGGPTGLDEAVYTDLRRSGLLDATAPVIATYVSSPQLGDAPLELLGLDPFAEAPFRSYLGADGAIPIDQLTAFYTQPGALLLSLDLSERYGLDLGDEIDLSISGQTQTAFVAGLLDPEDELSKRALNGLLIADVSTAQELTGKLGTLDRIDLILPDGVEDQLLSELDTFLPDGALVLPVGARTGTVEQMTSAFRTNLTALSLLALVVGLFLIYNTMTFSVVQRRPMFGTLRSLGVTRREVFLMVQTEALAIGVIGAGLGVGLGIALGQGAVRLVSQTINDLFFILTVEGVAIPTDSLIKGALLGVVATVIAAAFPAWEAASVPPRAALTRSSIEQKASRAVLWAALAGLMLIASGTVALFYPTNNLILSFGATFFITIGFALLTPITTSVLMRMIAYLTGGIWGALGRMAPREVVNSISRTSVAVAALMIAVSVTIGVGLMVGSFRFTVVTWMEQILTGDVYISVPGTGVSEPTKRIDPEAVTIMENWPGVQHADLLRAVAVDSPDGPINIAANNNPSDGEEQLYFAATGTPKEVWDAVKAGAVVISEPLANRLNFTLEDESISLFTDTGPREFEVAAIYYDYSSTQGTVIMWLDNYRQIWNDESITAVALRLEPGQDVDAVTQELSAALTPIQELLVQPNLALRTQTLEVFDRTFAITSALQLLTMTVAFVGVLSAMLSLQLEKQRQLGILKAIGLTARQLWSLILLETGLMGSVAGLLAWPTGYGLAIILIYIINRRSFGWTLQLQLVPEPFIQALIVAVFAALLAGLYPAYRISRRVAADAIRFD
ncbi:MAG: ABC transporter permease [Chloroflexi bacterium]|nr:MAG: ABC transporter permease [Chloroflexota bacterium]MBL1196419.1 ABC transporter permease [Chloroflexota bacterium]NOH13714.1 ABC transporter permease [Chloroflexota bacterium]